MGRCSLITLHYDRHFAIDGFEHLLFPASILPIELAFAFGDLDRFRLVAERDEFYRSLFLQVRRAEYMPLHMTEQRGLVAAQELDSDEEERQRGAAAGNYLLDDDGTEGLVSARSVARVDPTFPDDDDSAFARDDTTQEGTYDHGSAAIVPNQATKDKGQKVSGALKRV